jgi:hypothetical protein
MVQAERRKTCFYAEAKPMFAVDFSKSPAKVRSFFETTKLLRHFFMFSVEKARKKQAKHLLSTFIEP